MHADFSCPAVYTDADWANSKDDRKSISGYISIFAGGATTWSSKKQATVVLSTMEAEYIALSHAARENLWLRSLFTELNLPPSRPFPIFCDNRGAIDFTFNTGYHARSKHIDMRHHFIRDLVTSHEVSVHHCASEDNLADIFTKPLARTQHEEQVCKLGMTRVWEKGELKFSRCPPACKCTRLQEEWDEEDQEEIQEGDWVFIT
jgi:hypothetical protein